jgi:hypothetical protein
MANHVNSYIEFVEINEKAKEHLQHLEKKFREMDWGRRWYGDLFVTDDLSYDDVEQYSWTTEHIGPKWCYVQDYDFEGDAPYMSMESAWSPPELGLQKLLGELTEYDPNMVTTITYEDEMPNFVGWSVYVGTELEDACEWDNEEIMESVFAQHPHLEEQWNSDEDYWVTDEDGDMTEESEAAQEEYQDVIYEVIGELTGSGVRDTLEHLNQNEEE